MSPVGRGIHLVTSLLLALSMAGCASGSAADPQAGPAVQSRNPAGQPPAVESGEAAGGERREARDVAPAEPASLTPAQQAAGRVESVEVSPASIELEVGLRLRPDVRALDATGREVEGVQLMRFVQGQAAFFDPATGEVEAVEPGEAVLLVGVMKTNAAGDREMVITRAPIRVRPLPVSRLEIQRPEGPLFAHTRRRIEVAAFSELRREGMDAPAVFGRTEFDVAWASSDPAVARVTHSGLIVAGEPGEARLTASSEGVSAEVIVRVVPNPVRSLRLEPEVGEARVGDVVWFTLTALDSLREAVIGVGAEWSVSGLSGQAFEAAWISAEGEFVASQPGLYRVTATVGALASVAEVRATPREGRRKIEKVAHVPVAGHTTSDLWVFEGSDGRDYAYTGTHAAGRGGNVMYAWDVTEPRRPVLTDSVVVDARVVNDVKVNASATVAVVTREGASDRRNGIVILDIRDPAHPAVISSYTEGLTAGIHNTWIEEELVYAINNGTRAMHVVDISDPVAPAEVGRWELEKENKYLHDVMVKDGLAYLSYWDDGLVILDVGAGIRGGTPTEPRFVSQYKYRTRHGSEEYGNTHHAIRYKNYVFLSDEIMGCEDCINGPRGWVHVVDVTEIEEPREVARYRVPEAGTHNLWVEDDRLYVAYYQGGMRVVDVSGELRGDLYRQGRELGWYMTQSADGFTPNATMSWGSQPHKGNIFVSDMNSGLWIVKLQEPLAP
ncbi:MAG: hypothetical protein JSV95_13725 [Gemmatimonadota bacterium]|nr:MAG: hypothetical protein JSV95_13725 [Gemmatimonadota bacterium]